MLIENGDPKQNPNIPSSTHSSEVGNQEAPKELILPQFSDQGELSPRIPSGYPSQLSLAGEALFPNRPLASQLLNPSDSTNNKQVANANETQTISFRQQVPLLPNSSDRKKAPRQRRGKLNPLSEEEIPLTPTTATASAALVFAHTAQPAPSKDTTPQQIEETKKEAVTPQPLINSPREISTQTEEILPQKEEEVKDEPGFDLLKIYEGLGESLLGALKDATTFLSRGPRSTSGAPSSVSTLTGSARSVGVCATPRVPATLGSSTSSWPRG